MSYIGMRVHGAAYLECHAAFVVATVMNSDTCRLLHIQGHLPPVAVECDDVLAQVHVRRLVCTFAESAHQSLLAPWPLGGAICKKE